MKSFKLRVWRRSCRSCWSRPAVVLAQTRTAAKPRRGDGGDEGGTAAGAAQQYTRQQIDQLIAPIALYPDQLLAQVLMAATYPQQLVEAADWLQDPRTPRSRGDELVAALDRCNGIRASRRWSPFRRSSG